MPAWILSLFALIAFLSFQVYSVITPPFKGAVTIVVLMSLANASLWIVCVTLAIHAFTNY